MKDKPFTNITILSFCSSVIIVFFLIVVFFASDNSFTNYQNGSANGKKGKSFENSRKNSFGTQNLEKNKKTSITNELR